MFFKSYANTHISYGKQTSVKKQQNTQKYEGHSKSSQTDTDLFN